MRTTTNRGLKVWDQPSDQFDPDDLAFNWDTIDSALAPVVAPGSELVYSAITTDTTTTNTSDPGATLVSFSAATYTNSKHYFHLMVPRIAHTVTNGTVKFRLRESASDIVGVISEQLSTTAGNAGHLNIIAPFTPSAGAHTYTVTWWTTVSGTLTINTTSLVPAIFRIIKA